MQSCARGQMSHFKGEAAEQCIALDYERRGYRIAARRWRGQGGEIDLIVRKGDLLVFVEVKSSRTKARAAEQLGQRQMARICLSAQGFLAEEPAGQLTDMRFDVAVMDTTGAFDIVENAFGQY